MDELVVDAPAELNDRHFGGTLTRMVVEYFSKIGGQDAVEELLVLAGETRDIAILCDDASWSSYNQFRRLLEAAGELLGGADQLDVIGRTAALAAGSSPETIEALQDLGSPGALFATIDAGQSGITTVIETAAHERSPTEWVIESRFRRPFEAFAEFCSFALGLDSLAPGLFGFTDVEVFEETCVRNGDDWCRASIRWKASDEYARRVSFLDTRVQLLEMRLESFQRSVAELVSAEDLDTVLGRIVSAAARAVRAPIFVLALEPLPWSTGRVYAEGISSTDAEVVAEAALALKSPEDMTGGIAADVASTRCRYGRLVALDPNGSVMTHERTLLEAYARLAATALDSATALDEARRQSVTAHHALDEAQRQTATATALLELSMSLAGIASVEEMAANIARATAKVIDCDRALFLVAQQPATTATIVATHGFDAAATESLVGANVAFGGGWADEILFVDRSMLDPAERPIMFAHELAALVVVPVAVDNTVAGALVAGVMNGPERLARNDVLHQRLRGLAAQAATAMRNARLVDAITHQALHDSLTGLPNRSLVNDRVERLLNVARRNRSPVALLFIDLDGFKNVNDGLGHETGDKLLQAVAARLTTAARDTDTVGRLGGDEFVVVTDAEPHTIGATLVAERLLAVLREPYTLDNESGLTVRLTASIGIAVGERATVGELFRDADLALYRAKDEGKDRYVVFAPEMHTSLQDRLTLERELRDALDVGEFSVVYQPIFDLQQMHVTSVEALLRWNHPTRGTVYPGEFIPVLEETGLIVEAGAWVLREACEQTAAWRERGHAITVSVNVSVVQLNREEFVEDLRTILDETGFDPSALVLEITESVIMRDAAHAIAQLRAIKNLGVRIAIDDLGTGYSSLSYLKQFPIDIIKIDRTFITGITTTAESSALARTFVQLGQTLGLTTVAEGIENNEQLESLRAHDCDSGQGFLFAHPLEPAELESFLMAQAAANELDRALP